MTRIYIHVSGGLVQTVYANGPVNVEVIDLDAPAFMTEEEEAKINEREAILKAVENNPDFSAVW